MYLYVHPPPSLPSKTKTQPTLLYVYSCVWMQMHASSTAHAWRRGQLGVSPYLLPCLETGFCVLLVFHPALLVQASWDSPASTSHLTVGLLYSHTWLFVDSENSNSDPCLHSRWFTHWTISPVPIPSGLETSLLKEQLVGMNSVEFSLGVPWSQRFLQSQFPELYYNINLQRRRIHRCCFHEKVSNKM